jgi:hypothetical protein
LLFAFFAPLNFDTINKMASSSNDSELSQLSAPIADDSNDDKKAAAAAASTDEIAVPDMSLLDITEESNERGIPAAKFIDDVGAFSNRFTPPASAELMIGAYTQLFHKYKAFEGNLQNRRTYVTNR